MQTKLPLMTESGVLSLFHHSINYPLLSAPQIPTTFLLQVSGSDSQAAVHSSVRHLVLLVEVRVISCECEMT